MKVIITGFEPFGSCDVNPSEQIVHALAADPPPSLDLVTAVLPVDGSRAPDLLVGLVTSHGPDAVICLGVAANREHISVERWFVNELNYRIPDNAGITRTDEPIVPHGPARLASTLPVDHIVEAIEAAGVAVELSDSAGRYLCNHVSYTLLHALGSQARTIPAGFIHVPPLTAITLEKQVEAIRLTCDVLNDESSRK